MPHFGAGNLLIRLRRFVGPPLASKEYYMFAGGYSALSEQDIKRLIDGVHGNDLVLAYITHQRMRQPLRRVLSKCFTFLMNSITGLEPLLPGMR